MLYCHCSCHLASQRVLVGKCQCMGDGELERTQVATLRCAVRQVSATSSA